MVKRTGLSVELIRSAKTLLVLIVAYANKGSNMSVAPVQMLMSVKKFLTSVAMTVLTCGAPTDVTAERVTNCPQIQEHAQILMSVKILIGA